MTNPCPDCSGECAECGRVFETPSETNPSVALAGLEVDIYRAEDGKLVVSIAGPGDDDCSGLGEPNIRIWLNEALIYEAGRVGDDLSGGSFPAPIDNKD